jgi:hypothetical protein
MPMAIEPKATSVRLNRRDWLSQAAIAGLSPWLAGTALASQTASPTDTLIASWQSPNSNHIGLIDVDAAQWRISRSLVLPTRAHGLAVEGSGSVLALARRPGDWLLRWQPSTGKTQWHWIESDRQFNGHVASSPQGDTLWTTETNLETAQGLLGVRERNSLKKIAEWSTQGMDPHALLVLPQSLGQIPAGSLIVANGGIPTLPETGRVKRGLDRMDASLIALNPHTGAVLGQWHLADPFLSIRHLAWDPVSRRLGIALQAEHLDSAQRLAAPVLAVWDGEQLLPATAQPSLRGYGGDICALPGGGFAVSCPRADTLALFTSAAVWRQNQPHRQVCALTEQRNQLWASGQDGVLSMTTPPTISVVSGAANAERLQFDNHWLNFN